MASKQSNGPDEVNESKEDLDSDSVTSLEVGRDALEKIQLEPAVRDWAKDLAKYPNLNWKAHVSCLDI